MLILEMTLIKIKYTKKYETHSKNNVWNLFDILTVCITMWTYICSLTTCCVGQMITSVPPSGGALKNAISRISTEYRLQFAWPKGSKNQGEDKGSAGAGGVGPPRKSLSMGAIKPTGSIMPLNTAIAAVHKKRITDADRKFGELESYLVIYP